MAWVKKRYKTAGGFRWAVGYKDHEGVERTRGGFTSSAKAGDWRDEVSAATEGGSEELKAFLDRSLRGVFEGVLTLQQLYALWFAQDANPERPGGLARATWQSYKIHWNVHVAPRVGDLPAEDFARPGPCSKLLKELEDDGAGKATVTRVRAVLSSLLSWGVEHEHVSDNGFSRIRRRRRRSNRSKQTSGRAAVGEQRATPRHRRQGRALSPRAAAAVYRTQLTDSTASELRALRDATATLAQYLLGCRNQELWGIRWEDVGPRTITFVEVVSYGALDTGKTAGSSRSITTPRLLQEVLSHYREALTAAGRAPMNSDFIFPGVAADGHLSANQARMWPRRYFVPACRALAGRPITVERRERRPKGKGAPIIHRVPRYMVADADLGQFGYLASSTQYSLRRGHMSVRLRAGEDSVVIAKECGTSVQMLHRHYADDIAEAGVDPRPLEEQLREALDWIEPEPQRRLRAI